MGSSTMTRQSVPISSDRTYYTTDSTCEADRPLVWALKMYSNFDKEKARHLIGEALAGDREAQREIDVNLLQESKAAGSEKMKQAMKHLLELLARGELAMLESARAELQAKYEARRNAKKIQCAQQGAGKYPTQWKNSAGCWSMRRTVSRSGHEKPDQC